MANPQEKGDLKTTTKPQWPVFRLLALFTLLFALAYFVIIPGVSRLRGYRLDQGFPVIPVDGAQNDISLGPDKKRFVLDVASTQASREKGLSGRTGLDQSHGMLFIFSEADNTCFWMKDMKFSIDILWFDQDQKLVHIAKDASPASYPKESFCSPTATKYVIEVAAGTVERLGLKLGDSFSQP